MQVPVHSFVIGQPINPVSWPRKLPKPTYISVNTARRPASADSTCTVSSTDSSPVSLLPPSPSSANLLYAQARPETEVQRAVSRLLSLTKQLQEVLGRWAHHAAYEEDVSDAFLLVGSQFDATVHAFYHIGVDMRDLYDVPVTLRTALEGLLAEHPSPETLERYMPCIRTALVKLLRGLQAKQAPYWASMSRERDGARLSRSSSSLNLADG